MKLKIAILVFIFGQCLLNGSMPSFSDYYVISKPDMEVLTGNYELCFHQMSHYEAAFDSKIKELKAVPKIVLNLDGSFRTRDFPAWLEYEAYKYKFNGFIASKGNWSLVVGGYMDDGKGGIVEHWGIKFEGLDSAENQPILIKRTSDFEILFIYGDPDSGEVVLFKKESDPAGG